MRLWDFCEQLYGDKRIELLCLDLQNRYQVNVGLVLWLSWLVKIGRFTDKPTFEQAQSLSLSFHETFIRPVRKLRKNAKLRTFEHGNAIAQHLLNAEILLEREVLEAIEERFDDNLRHQAGASTYGLRDYLAACGVIDADATAQFLYAAAMSS